MRQYSPIAKCGDCGMVTAMLVFQFDLDDNGEDCKQIYRDNVPHSPAQCLAFQALEKETWPSLF